MASCWVCWFVLSTQIVAQSHHDWSYNLGLYEVNIRNYSEEGTFEAFKADLDRIDSLGAGILWLMPIHPIGEENRLGSLGSPYSVHLNTINELKVKVYDTMGRLQMERSLGVRNPGVHSVVIQASDWSSGTYLLRVYAGNEVHQQRISLIK